MRSSSASSKQSSGSTTSTPSTSATGSGSTPRSPAARPPRRRSRLRRAATSATSASGWSTRRSAGSSRSRTSAAAPDERRYRIPAGHDEVLLDRDSVNYMAAFARMMVGMVQPLPQVLEAFRSGEGVPYADFPPDFVEGQGDMNRTQFVNLLASEWLPAMPDVDERLRSGSARVADVACGTGWSSVAIAKAYPDARVDGFDLDPASIDARARGRAVRGRDRPRRLPGARRSRPGARRPLRPRDGVRGRARHGEAGRGAAGDPRPARRGRRRAGRRREGRRRVHGARRRRRARDVRLVDPALPPGRAGRAAVGRDRHGDARVDVPPLRRGGGFGKVEVVPIEHDFWRFYRLEA